MKNFFETDHASMPLGIFASKSVSHKTNVGGVSPPISFNEKHLKRISGTDFSANFAAGTVSYTCIKRKFWSRFNPCSNFQLPEWV